MRTQQIVPAVVVDEVGSLTVNGDVLLLVALYAVASLRIKLNEADSAEVGTIANPQTTCCGVEQYTWVDSVLVLHTVRGAHLNGC